MYRPMQVNFLHVPLGRAWVAFGSPFDAPPARRRSWLFTGDRLRLGGLPAPFLFPCSPFLLLVSPLLPCPLDSPSIRWRLAGESDILVVELL
jgi:hypothetical protein